MSVRFRTFLLFTVLIFFAASQPSGPVSAQGTIPSIDQAVQMVFDGAFADCTEDRPHENSDAVYRICTPPWWWPIQNGNLFIWAHGYVDITVPVGIPEDQLCVNALVCLPDLITFLGYDFITTSYAVNGLAVVPGIDDVIELVDLFTADEGEPNLVYLIGASEGGLITTLAVENHPEVFDGGLAACGPIGDFVRQVNYFGDFRVVFDYYFPGLMPGDPTDIPQDLIDNWDTHFEDVILPELVDRANRRDLKNLIRVTRVPTQIGSRFSTALQSIEDSLWYNVFATNNANDVLGGQPFDNINTVYQGSRDDAALNAGVQRIAGDPAAIGEINANYQTTGILSIPLITTHTTLDQQVPYWHEILYLNKTMASGAWPDLHEEYPPTDAYGHCMFATDDVLGAFDLLVAKVEGTGLNAELVKSFMSALPEEAQLMELHNISR